MAKGGLKTPSVALDAQVFHGESFNVGSRRLTQLAAHVKSGHVELVMTDVAVSEVKAGIARGVKDAVTILSKGFRTSVRILTGLPTHAQLFVKPDEEELTEVIVGRFEKFLADNQVTIVSSKKVKVGPILDRYFEGKAPFATSGEKKAEFPDAIAIEALDQWTEKEGKQVYVVSGDQGLRDGCAERKRLLPVEGLDQILSLATLTAAKAGLIAKVEQAVAGLIDEARIAAIEAFEALVFYSSDDEYEDIEVESVDVHDCAIGDLVIGDIDGDVVTLYGDATIDFGADVRYNDPDMTYHDREDGRTYAFNRIRARVDTAGTFALTITATLVDGDEPALEIDRAEVNAGLDIDIPLDDLEQTGSDLDDEERE